jgi:hypothetical protein
MLLEFPPKRLRWYALLICLLPLLGLTLLGSCKSEKKPEYEPLKNPWEIAVPNQEVPEGLGSLSAQHCGSSHQEHYAEWQQSTHANAWTDLQFQAELKKDSSPFMCINCHIPLQNQQEYIIKGLVDGDIYKPVREKNPHFDKALQQEGINCASCHVRNNMVVGPTGTALAPHKTVKDTQHLSEKLCIGCHNATAVVTPTLACSFETGDEWKAGPFHGEKNCIDCHMEEKHRPVVPGYAARKSRFHGFPGSGIPKLNTLKTTGLEGLDLYPGSLLRILSKSDSLKYRFVVHNAHAGHKVPTGDPERFFLFELQIHDQKDSVIYSQTERIGEHWQWYPTVKKLSDNNLLPGEKREFSFGTQIKEVGKYQLQFKVTKHRLNQKNADYNKLPASYPLYKTLLDTVYPFRVGH